MARSLIGGLLKRGQSAASIAVAEPFAATAESLARDFGVVVHSDSASAVVGKGIWLLAVKHK